MTSEGRAGLRTGSLAASFLTVLAEDFRPEFGLALPIVRGQFFAVLDMIYSFQDMENLK
jgi:hypothetical protein